MNRAGWRLLADELRPYRRSLLTVAGLAVLLSIPMIVSGLIIARALDEGFLVRRVDVGLFWLALLAQVRLAGAALTRMLFPPLVRIVEPLRDRLVSAAAMAGLDRALHDGVISPGSTVRQTIDEAEAVRRLLGTVLRNIHTTLSVAIGAMVGLTVLSPVTALVLAPCLAAAAVAYRAMVRLALRRQHQAILIEEDLAEQATRVFTTRRDIVAFTAEQDAARPIHTGIAAARRAALALARVAALRVLTVGLGVDLAVVLLLALAPALISAGHLSSGDLAAAVFYVTFGFGPAMRFLVYGGSGWLVNLIAVAARLSQVVTASPVPTGHTDQAPPCPAEPAIILDRITFSYSPTAAPVLDNITLTIPYGAHLAVVGPSGAGKSTLAGVICGLHTCRHGTVRVGGRSASALPAQSLVLIPQEAYVFAGTIRENLAYLASQPSDEELLSAARRFGLDEVIARHGLDGEVPPAGAGLSAGERQLITIVRAYLSNAPIIILDEATSHLDPSTEQRAESLLRQRGGTLVVIAHRISSAQRASQVLLVDHGHVTVGTHADLLASNHRYRELTGHWDPQPATPYAAPMSDRRLSGMTVAAED